MSKTTCTKVDQLKQAFNIGSIKLQRDQPEVQCEQVFQVCVEGEHSKSNLQSPEISPGQVRCILWQTPTGECVVCVSVCVSSCLEVHSIDRVGHLPPLFLFHNSPPTYLYTACTYTHMPHTHTHHTHTHTHTHSHIHAIQYSACVIG